MPMVTSKPGVGFICEWEDGPHLQPYDDGYGFQTIGWGHLIGPDELWMMGGITREQAVDLLCDDLREAERAINSMGIDFEQHQFDALVCFTFNIGVTAFRQSTVRRRLLEGDMDAPVEEFPRWNKVRKQVSSGLSNRRMDEVELWLNADYQRDH